MILSAAAILTLYPLTALNAGASESRLSLNYPDFMKCEGFFRHCFHGTDTTGIIALRFESEPIARGALELLPGFRQGKDPAVIIGAVTQEQLNQFKAIIAGWHLEIQPCGMPHCRTQCRDAEIDNTNHSIDYGASWTMDVPVVHPDQMSLVLA